MTVSTTHIYKQYNGNGVTTTFPIDFQFFDASEIVATLIDADGDETSWSLGADFTISGGSGSTGSLEAEEAPASGTSLRIERATTPTQALSWAQNDSFSETSMNNGLDRREMRIQEVNAKAQRAIKQSWQDYIDGGSEEIELPAPSANKVLGWNPAGDQLINIELDEGSQISGALQADNNLSDVLDAAASFAAIKQAATTTATGVVELATDAEAITGTDTVRAVTPAALAATLAALAGLPQWVFDSKSDLDAATVDASVNIVQVFGYAAYADAPPLLYKRVGSEPSHPGKTTSNGGAVHWEIYQEEFSPENFGAVRDGTTDDQVAIENAELARFALKAILRFLSGNYYLAAPSSILLKRPRWQGAGGQSTLLLMDGNNTALFMTGAGGFTGGFIHDMTIWAPVSRTMGIGLLMDGDATFQPDEFQSRNLRITGTGTYGIVYYLSGFDRVEGGGAPQGLRFVSFTDLFAGRGTTLGVYCSNTVQMQLHGGGTYGGTGDGNDVQFDGNATTKRPTDCMMTAFKVNGTLNFVHGLACIAHVVAGDVFLSVDTDYIQVSGVATGGVTDNGGSNNVAGLAV